MAVKYDKISAYERLFEAIKDVVQQANAGTVHYPQGVHSCFVRNREEHVFECFILLKDWKWRSTKTNESVTIVMHVRERMDRNAEVLLASSVEVSYYVINNGVSDLLHSVHYDYGEPRSSHPLFHAQMSRKAIILPSDTQAHYGCEGIVFKECELGCYKNSRIPTSDMTLGSVLLCLAADHLPADFFVGFRSQVIDIQRLMPQPRYESLKGSISHDQGHLRSSHWFAHHQ